MKSVKVEKMRMCPYCEGTVPLDASKCRFCGSSLDAQSPKKKSYNFDEYDEYIPPYQPKGAPSRENVYTPEYNEDVLAGADDNIEEEKGHLAALLLLSCGGMLFTLSVMLYFFSEHGRLVLEWKSRYWSLYMLIGLPMLYYGLKKLRTLN